MQFGLPTIIIAVYLKGYYDMFKDRGTGMFVFWMIVAAAFLAFIFALMFGKDKKEAVKETA